MAHWKKNFDYNFLGSHDLYNEEKETYNQYTFTIDKAGMTKATDQSGQESQVLAVWFDQADKPMILNKTNCKNIEVATKQHDTDKWKGQNVIVYVQKGVRAFGTTTDALRIKPFLGRLELPNLPEDKLQLAAQRLKQGKIEAVQKKFKISSDQLKQIQELAKTL
ncbi:hypothetical protein N9H09_01325 [bacterium]|nr:hypothetical protein [bacterium]